MYGSCHKRLSRLCFAAALATGLVSGAAASVAQDAPPVASAVAFDVLFKRLEIGDLTEIDAERQLPYLAQLKQLLPAGDAHRQRLLDAQRCELEFKNANKEGFAFADAKLTEALQSHDDAAAIRFYYCRGEYREYLGTPRDALADFESGIELARKTGDDQLLASGLGARGSEYSLLGVHGKALADLLEAQRVFAQRELTQAANSTLQSIGIAYRRLGYPDKAREYLMQSIDHAQQVGDHETQFISVIQLGYADDEAGQYDKALANDQRAIELAGVLDDRSSMGSGNLAKASVLTSLHRYSEALDTLQKAEADFAAAGDLANEGMLQFQRGRALSGLGQHRRALEHFARAEAVFDKSGNPRYEEMLHENKARTLEADGQAAAALAEFKRYLALHDSVEQARSDQQAQMLRAQFDADRSNLENARLKAEQTLKDRQVRSLQRVRQWQQTAMALLAVLIGLLALFVIRQLRKARSWKRMASLDPLTGVANRRGVEQFTAAAMRQARSRHEPLAVLALDLDRFKQINDNYGHAAGDRVLQHIARACQDALRDNDLLGRIGGEEFLVVLPGSDLHDAADVAERLRGRIEALTLEDLPAGLRTTISIGVAQMTSRDSGFADLEQRADLALYRAKSSGRNRVVGADAALDQELGTAGAAAPAAAATGGGGTVAS
jgi:diguanylate cyclase (GGDEF)-like protein